MAGRGLRQGSRLRTTVLLLLAIGLAAPAALASVPLAPGATMVIGGTTAAAEPDLAGGVIRDELIKFSIVSAGGVELYRGVLQDRVVKSTATGALHFYHRIRDTAPGLPGSIRFVSRISFALPAISVDWRPDGLGAVNPRLAHRSAVPGAEIRFEFPGPGIAAGADSRFFYVKTRATKFDVNGKTRIILATGQSVSLQTAQPLP